MLASFRVFKLYGIDIRIHPTFFLLPVFFSVFYARNFGPGAGLRASVLVMGVFACVLAHELAHSVMARRFGIRVPCITLYPIGGVASMEQVHRQPRQEFLIAVVGPLFNFLFALILYFPLKALIGTEDMFSPGLESWSRTWANLFWINPVLGAFNLIPAFPMDGGRALRSLLSGRLGYVKATQISAYVGRVFAILFILLGLWTRHWMLILIALFIYTAASSEERQLFYNNEVRSGRDST